MTKPSPFRYFRTSPEIIRQAVMMYVRFPLSLRNVQYLLHERGIDISHESVRFWWNRFGPMFAAEIRRKRVEGVRAHSDWQWHLDEVFVKINGEGHYPPSHGSGVNPVNTGRKHLSLATLGGANYPLWIAVWKYLNRFGGGLRPTQRAVELDLNPDLRCSSRAV